MPMTSPRQEGQGFKVTMANTDQSFVSPTDDVILDAAEESGVEIPSSCRSGKCGTCKVLLVQGKVESDESSALSETENEEGYILTCCSRPITDLVLDRQD